MTPAPDMRCLAISYQEDVNMYFSMFEKSCNQSLGGLGRMDDGSEGGGFGRNYASATHPFCSDIKHVHCARRGTNEDMSTCGIEPGGGHYRPTYSMEHSRS